MNDLFEFVGKISLKMDGLEKSLDDAVDKAEEATAGMMDKFKGAAKVIGGLFVADKIIDFGKTTVEAAASAKAMQAQFEQVFEDMASNAQTKVEELGDKFGVLPNRIRPYFTQVTSMFKGLGLSTEQAMEQASIATTLASDAAAFYDKSLEDASGALGSFIKGNYEGGESIGLFANDTQMAAYAIKNNLIEATDEQKKHAEQSALAVEKAQVTYSKAVEKYGESSLQARDAQAKLNKAIEDQEKGPNLTSKWASMGEAQKQIIRLKFAEEMYKQGGAAGQAAREADGWENVMGNLNQAWQDFLAVVGAPVLEALIPIVQGVTGGVVAMSEAVKGIIEGYQSWSKEHPIIAQFLQTFVILLATLATGFGIYTAATTLATTVTTAFGAIMALVTSPITLTIATIAALGAIIYTVWQNWETIGPMMAQFWEDTKATVSNIIDGFVSAIVSFFSGLWDSIVQSCTDIYNSVSEWFAKIPTEIENIWNSVTSFLSSIDLFEIGTNIIQGLMDGINSMAQGVVDSVGGVVGGAIDWAKNLLGIHSPSRVFKEIGQFTGEGLVQGINNQITDIEDASARMAEALHFDPATVDYTFKKEGSVLHEQAPTQSERLLDEIIQVLRALLDKDSIITLDGQKVAELLNPKIKQLNQQEEIRNNRMRGVRA